MKKILLLAAFLTSFLISAQQHLAVDSMEVNSMKVQLCSDGGMGKISTLDSSIYKTLVFAQNLWIGGHDANNNLRVSAHTYSYYGHGYDFFPGPISDLPFASVAYNKVYHVKLQTISNFVNGNTNGVPAEIADWPAHGNSAMGEAANLAPFVDVNLDGQYDPADGDYPDIKGDEALFAIFNDQNDDTTGTALGVEIHMMLYGYNSGGAEDSVLYLDYKVFNRSANTYVDAYLSSFADYDLGNHTDDLIGTNVHANSVFAYNGTPFDAGPEGFGAKPAACGMRLLKGPPAPYFDGIDNDKDGCVDGIIDANGNCVSEDPAAGIREHYKMSGSMYFANIAALGGLQAMAMSSPSASSDYYNYMQSLWKNGYDLIIENPSGFYSPNSGDGLVGNNTGTKTRVMFPGNSYDTIGAFEPMAPVDWFASPASALDYRTLINAGPFRLEAGASFDVNMAVAWGRGGSDVADGYNLINKKLENLDSLHSKQPVRNVSLASIKAKASYEIHYRPDADQWFVRNHREKKLELKLYATSGQLLKSFVVDGGTSEVVPTSSLAKGIYLVVDEISGHADRITR